MPTIAVVANDRNVMTSVCVVLEAEGYRIAAYTDGVSALSGFQTAPPDLAILDIKIPRLDGAEALRLLRTKFSRSGKLRCPESGILGAPQLPAALELEADPSCAD